MTESRCRACGERLDHVFADLGSSPLANTYLEADELNRPEAFYPLCALVCAHCLLVQLDEYEPPESIFADYAYFSSYSTTWLQHAQSFADAASRRLGLNEKSLVVEVASNDGYLLQYFAALGIPVLGIEPAANVAAVAETRGVPTRVAFFGRQLAQELRAEGLRADLLVGNNVLAHVPDLNDFVAGLARLLAPTGTLVLEVPHLLHLVEDVQFDTIYHEHFSYFSFLSASAALERHGLVVFDVAELSTHGGSLRIFACLPGSGSGRVQASVKSMRNRERALGYDRLEIYETFAERVREEKRRILSVLIDAKERGMRLAAYGAPAKGNTLLNYCGIRGDFIDFTTDLNPRKQGRFLPGSHIPIRSPDEIERTRPDLLFILPWNLKDEIIEQMSVIRDWGGRFLVRTPGLEVVP
jgi:SAM-dependent methyltransferase